MKISSIDVFCSVSGSEIKDVNAWLVPSLENQRGVARINLCLINYTGKGSIYDGKNSTGKVSIREICKGKQLGFGESHNFAFEAVKPIPYFFIVNPDVYLHEDCVSELIEKIESDKNIGIVEARQLPFEHPKEYDKQTGEIPWASGFGMLMRSEFFEKVGGFDENFWMYCEDVDLSWRAWMADYKVIYERNAIGYHFTGIHSSHSQSRFHIEQFWSARNFLYIMYKYWGKRGERKARNILGSVDYPESFKEAVRKSFEDLKKNINSSFYDANKEKVLKLSGKIKVRGFNQYHEMT